MSDICFTYIVINQYIMCLYIEFLFVNISVFWANSRKNDRICPNFSNTNNITDLIIRYLYYLIYIYAIC